jgi:hypothetical protein
VAIKQTEELLRDLQDCKERCLSLLWQAQPPFPIQAGGLLLLCLISVLH